MSAVGAVLAVLVVLQVDGHQIELHAPDAGTQSASSTQSLKNEPPTGGVTRYPDWDQIVDAISRAAHPSEYDDLTDNQKARSSLPWQGFRLPGFGSLGEDDCGECIPESRHFCTDCGKLHPIPRNCFEYDCPMHAMQAVRRRAAGTDHDDHPGVVPQLDALARRLGSYYNTRFNFYHLTVSPPEDYVFESDEPLRRAVGIGDHDGVIPEIMDALGIQGVVAAHSHRGDDENHATNDMGEWRQRLPPWTGTDRDWHGDVRDELSAEPHFHVVGVAPWQADDNTLAGTERIEDETGWVIHAIEGQDGSTVIGSNASNPTQKTKSVARAVTYALSHALVYDAGDQRRLGAWMKGPDVNTVDVYRGNYERVHTITQQVASRTLGVPAPSLECDNKIRKEVDVGALQDDTLPHLDRPSQQRSPLEAGYHDPLPHSTGSPGRSGPITETAMGGATDSAAGLGRNGVGTVDLDPDSGGTRGKSTPDDPARADTSASRSSASADADTPDDSSDDDRHSQDFPTEDGLVECGGHLDHISQAGAKLATPDWVAEAPHSEELDGYYRAYVRRMESQGLDLEDGRTEIPEYQDTGPPD